MSINVGVRTIWSQQEISDVEENRDRDGSSDRTEESDLDIEVFTDATSRPAGDKRCNYSDRQRSCNTLSVRLRVCIRISAAEHQSQPFRQGYAAGHVARIRRKAFNRLTRARQAPRSLAIIAVLCRR